MPRKTNVVYLQNGTAERPSVRISKTTEGITFSVNATGRSLNLARIRAEKCYRDLTDFVTTIEKRERQVADARAERLVCPLDRLARGLDVRDVAVDDGVLGKRLDGVALHTVDVTTRLGDLDHLDRRRTDVAAHQGWRLRLEEVEMGC